MVVTAPPFARGDAPPAPDAGAGDDAPSASVPTWISSSVAATAMLLGTSAFLRFVQPDEPGFADADVRAQLVWFALYLAAGAILVVRVVSRHPLALPDPFLRAYVLLALASTVWSANPDVTTKRSLALVGTAAVGTLLASEWSFESMLRLARWVLAFAAGASLALAVAALLVRSTGSQDLLLDDGMQGVFFHKNGLGRAMAFGALTVVLQSFLRRRFLRSDLVLLLMFATLVALSRSATAVVLAGLALGLLLTLPLLLRPAVHMALVGAGLAAAGALVVIFGLVGVGFDDVAGLLGRDPSLTGRVGVWAAAADTIGDRMALGHGFAAFWVEGYQPAVLVAQLARFRDVTQGHNGYIDILLQLGVGGLAVVAGSFAVTGRRMWRRVRSGDDRAAAMAAVVVFIAAANVTESSFQQHSFFMMVLFAVSAAAGSTAGVIPDRGPAVVPSTRSGPCGA